MNYVVIKTQSLGDIIGEVVKDGWLFITVKNVVRLLDTSHTGKISLGYTIYSPFIESNNLKINKLSVVSITPLKQAHHGFYEVARDFINNVVNQEMDKEVGKFTLEIKQGMQRFSERKEYLDTADLDPDTEDLVYASPSTPKHKLN